nr:hypothetical protein CFP56_01062 [Quercus suber]
MSRDILQSTLQDCPGRRQMTECGTAHAVDAAAFVCRSFLRRSPLTVDTTEYILDGGSAMIAHFCWSVLEVVYPWSKLYSPNEADLMLDPVLKTAELLAELAVDDDHYCPALHSEIIISKLHIKKCPDVSLQHNLAGRPLQLSVNSPEYMLSLARWSVTSKWTLAVSPVAFEPGQPGRIASEAKQLRSNKTTNLEGTQPHTINLGQW